MSYSVLTSTHGTSVQSSEGRREILVDSAADLPACPTTPRREASHIRLISAACG